MDGWMDGWMISILYDGFNFKFLGKSLRVE
jgi:hypothetical protein